MKSIYLFSAISTLFILTACSATKKTTATWVNTEKIQGKSFHSIFIVVLTADIEARAKLENDLAAAAAAKGYKAVKSIDLMPPTISAPATPGKDEIANKVKASGCDAVFTASLLKKEEDVRYTPGTTAYSVRPYYSYYGSYYGFYSHYYPTVSTASYYTKEKTYFMQSNLYDAATEEIMWAVQSEIFNPSSLAAFSKKYTADLVKQLEKENLLKK